MLHCCSAELHDNTNGARFLWWSILTNCGFPSHSGLGYLHVQAVCFHVDRCAIYDHAAAVWFGVGVVHFARRPPHGSAMRAVLLTLGAPCRVAQTGLVRGSSAAARASVELNVKKNQNFRNVQGSHQAGPALCRSYPRRELRAMCVDSTSSGATSCSCWSFRHLVDQKRIGAALNVALVVRTPQ